MSIARRASNTILLGGGLPGGDQAGTVINEYPAGVAITPGMLIELFRDSDNFMKWRPHASAGEVVTPVVALEKSLHNKTIDDAYAIGELVYAYHLRKSSTWNALVPSGQNISNAEYLQSNGDGRMKSASATTADANVAQFQSLDDIGAVTATVRCRVQVL